MAENNNNKIENKRGTLIYCTLILNIYTSCFLIFSKGFQLVWRVFMDVILYHELILGKMYGYIYV